MKTNAFLPAATAILLAASATAATHVTTWRYDNYRTGQDLTETQLTPKNVNSATFGKIASFPVDGFVYAQPLYLSGINIAGAARNVVYIATEHESVYAFDVDHNQQLWKVSLVDTAHGAASGAASVPSQDVGTNDMVPEVGITATPVIDPATNTIYVVAKSKENGGYVQRLHALDVTTGNEQPNSPVQIQATVPGTGSGSVNGIVSFDSRWQLGRPGLLLLNGQIYMAFASHGDNGDYHGWVLAYDEASLQQTGVYNTSPNGREVGIWESGAGLAADTLSTGGRIFFSNGNGDTNTGDYGNAVERLDVSNGLQLADQWTPFDTQLLSAADADQSSGGVLLLPDQPGAHPHEMIQVGKNGRIEVLDRDNLGGFDPTTNHVVQEIAGQINGLWSTPAYWNGNVYFWGVYGPMYQYSLANGLLSSSYIAQTVIGAGYPGSSPVVSSNGTNSGIVWAIRSDAFYSGGPTILYAFDATNVGTLLYSSDQNPLRDTAGPPTKFTVPVVADGKVFVGTEGEVDVYGLLASVPPAVPAPVFSPAPGVYAKALPLVISEAQAGATVYYTTDGSIPTPSSNRYSGPINIESTTSVQAIAIAPGFSNSSDISGAYTIGAVPSIDFSNGFSSVRGLTLNGSAMNVDDSRLQLTNGGYGEAGSFFWNTPVDIRSFSNYFTFQLSGVRPMGDGITFTIQNSAPTALGWYGGELGYGPIQQGPPSFPNSIAIKFDLYDNAGEGNDSTGMYLNGVSPKVPAVDLTNSGIDLSSGDTLICSMTYNGTTLTLTIFDPVNGSVFSTGFAVDIPGTIGSNTAFAGFTGATGGFSASQKILSWVYKPIDVGSLPSVPAPLLSLPSGTYGAAQTLTLTDEQPGTQIYYTVDGTVPTAASIPYAGPLTISRATMVQAMAIAPGYADSGVASAQYTIASTAEPAWTSPVAIGTNGSTGIRMPVAADFNGDGKLDLAFTNTASSSISITFGNGDGTFQPTASYPTALGANGLVVGDFNGDGKPDLAVLNSANGTLGILLNQGEGVFPLTPSFTYSVGKDAASIAVGDLNKDGVLDLVVTLRDSRQITILTGKGDGTFLPTGTVSTTGTPDGSVVADLDQDGYADLIVWSAKNSLLEIFHNNQGQGLTSVATYTTGKTPDSLAVQDFNGDGYPDLVVAAHDGNTLEVFLNDKSGALRPGVPYATGRTPLSVLALDMNGDHIPDLVLGNYLDGTVGVLLGKGDGSFTSQVTYPTVANPFQIVSGDFNGDGRQDLAVTSYSPIGMQALQSLARPPITPPVRAQQVTVLLQTPPTVAP